jgi:hypothetical protein
LEKFQRNDEERMKGFHTAAFFLRRKKKESQVQSTTQEHSQKKHNLRKFQPEGCMMRLYSRMDSSRIQKPEALLDPSIFKVSSAVAGLVRIPYG